MRYSGTGAWAIGWNDWKNEMREQARYKATRVHHRVGASIEEEQT